MSKDFKRLELKDGIEDVQKLLSFKHVFPDALRPEGQSSISPWSARAFIC
jgi:hypothetical protein